MRFHFPQADEACKIQINFYTKRPNRIDLAMDDVFKPATNAKVNGDAIEWQKPDPSIHVPGVDSHDAGSNFFNRDNQLFQFVISGGHTYTLTTVQTLVLELEVMTELTDDEFYDNGNLANNIAALLGISPDKIRIMNVIREDSGSRRRRWAELGFVEYQVPGRFRRSDAGASLQIEIEPENSSKNAAKALDKAAEEVVAKAADVAATVGDALGAEVTKMVQFK